jgi:pimeloyl-ACP methyl ester carboxylesterase
MTEAWHSGGRWLSVEGLRLFVSVYGQGPPLLALHAFPTSSYDYMRVVPLLARHYQVFLFDFPGFGYSEKPRTFPYSLLRYADMAQAVARIYGLTRVSLLAHDIGASVALELLGRDTPVVERFVMLNASIQRPPRTRPSVWLGQRVFLHPLLGPLSSRLRLMRRSLFARTIQPLFAHTLTRAELNAFYSLVANNDGVGIYHRLMCYIPNRRAHEGRWIATLASHPAPLTLIWGQADPVAVPAIAERVVQLRPDARYIRLEGVGHYPHWEAPERTASFVVEALSGS